MPYRYFSIKTKGGKMKKIIILSVTILFLAGCKVPEILGLKEMPVTQVAAQKEEALRQIKAL